MKIGIYDPYLDDCGGGEKYMMTLAACLSSEHEVSVFWDKEEDFQDVRKRFSLELSGISLVPNIFARSVSTLSRVLETRKYDVLIVLSDGSIPFTLSKKLFLHIQRPLKAGGAGIKEKIKFSKVNKIFCNSYYTKGYIDKQVGSRAIVIYPPIDLHPQKMKKENIILHVGRFRVIDKTVGVKDYKKQYVMVEAFKKMVNNGLKGWRFVIAVGVNNEDLSELEKLREKAKGLPVKFLINKSNEDLWEIYSKSKIYWHASGFGEDLEKNPEAAEHFGITTVEAMGAGCVPVVINAGGQTEIVEDNVNGFLWNSMEELQEKTLLLTKENKILETMSGEASKRAKSFAGDRFCEEVKRMISS